MEKLLSKHGVAKVSEVRRQMNTDVELSLFISDLSELATAESALTHAHAYLASLEQELSEFSPQSPVYAFNQKLTPGASLTLPESTRALLALSLAVEKSSNGCFSPWAKSTRPGHAHLGFRFEGNTLTKLSPDLHLSFGAIGKGYALDQVADWIEKRGYTHWFFNAGGSSLLFQGPSPTPDRCWTIGLGWARNSAGEILGQKWSTPLGHTERTAIGVSGTLEQGYHVIDPRHSRAASSTLGESRPLLLAAVAQVGQSASAAEVDALSTALFVDPTVPLSSPRSTSSAPFPSLLIDSSQSLFHTPSWSRWFQPKRPNVFVNIW